MKKVFTFLLLTVFFSAYSVNEYQIKSNDCYGNNNDDNPGTLYPLNDSTFGMLLQESGKFGYFQNTHDTSNWIVKFDKNYKIISKTLINYKAIGDYKYDPVTKSVCLLYT